MKNNSARKIIVILGPNASGKSEFAVRLAKKINGEIISADSRQIYKGLDIGSGKVEGRWKKISNFKFLISNQNLNSKPQILNKLKIPASAKSMAGKQNSKQKKYFVYKGVIHHCIDITNPKRVFSAYDFKKCGEKAIAKIFSRGKIPIICGGAGFYIDALLGNVSLAETSTNPKLREKLGEKSCEELFKILQKLDAKRAKKIDKNNKRRLIRALEISLINAKSAEVKLPHLCGSLTSAEILYIGINRSPEVLKQRIEHRLKERLKDRMLKEVRNLHFKKGVSWKRLYDLGLEYRYVSLFLCEKEKIQKSRKLPPKEKKNIIEKTYADFVSKLKTEIWHYAKRQMTWFKRNKEIHWIDLSPERLRKAETSTKKFLAN